MTIDGLHRNIPKTVARLTGGEYFPLTNTNGLERSQDLISTPWHWLTKPVMLPHGRDYVPFSASPSRRGLRSSLCHWVAAFTNCVARVIDAERLCFAASMSVGCKLSLALIFE